MTKQNNKSNSSVDKMEKIVSLCKRRGFVFPNSEIYGGMANSWDYGPVGVELKNNIKQLWWKFFVQSREDILGIDGAIISNPKVWEASGHTEGFNDMLVDCKKCKERFRVDHLIEEQTNLKMEGKSAGELADILLKKEIKCPSCNKPDWTKPKNFNLLFKTHIGPVEDDGSIAYLRGETAQNMFVDFKNILNSNPKKLPFGLAQIGKAFRNEITTGNFIFRVREFEQMEIEYFIQPDADWKKIFENWLKEMKKWMDLIGVNKKSYSIRQHGKKELSHYSKKTVDIEYNFPFGTKELYGLAYRTDYDLSQHQKKSGQDLTYFDEEKNKRFLPHVIEPTFGVDRTFLMLLCEAYTEEKVKDNEKRMVLKLKPSIAPYKVAVFPLLKNKKELVNKAREVYKELSSHFNAFWDDRGNIGKRYRYQDEIGTPYCVTVDFDSIKDDSVTVRDRDSMKQERMKVEELGGWLEERIK